MITWDQITGFLSDFADAPVYVAIASVFVTGIVRCVIPVVSTGSSLKRGIKRLHARAVSDTPAWKDPLFLGKRLRNDWQRFLVNSEQLIYRGLSHNMDDYINDDAAVHKPGSGQFAELIPGLLTSLGILGTFIGLMNGLTGLDFSTSSSLITAVPGLLDGMRCAFATSVAGISCSLVFNIAYRFATGRAFKALDTFSFEFTQTALRRAPEDSVQLICQNQDQFMLLRGMAEDIGSHMAGTIDQARSRSMLPISDAMDRFITAATREQIDGVNRITALFITKMNESLNDELLSLGQTLSILNRNQVESNEVFTASLNNISGMTERISALYTSSGDILTRFEAYLHTLSVRRAKEAEYETQTTELLYKLHQAQMQQNALASSVGTYQANLEKHLNDYIAHIETTLNQIKHMESTSEAQINTASGHFAGASEMLSQSYGMFIENITEGFSRSLALFEVSIHDVINALSEQLDALANAHSMYTPVDAFSQIQRTLADIHRTLEELITKHEHNSGSPKEDSKHEQP